MAAGVHHKKPMEPTQSESSAVETQIPVAPVPAEVSAEEREKAHEHIRNLQTAVARERRLQKAAKRDPAVREIFEENQALGATIEGLRLKHESDREHLNGKVAAAESSLKTADERIGKLETELTSAYGKSAGFQARIVELEASLKSTTEAVAAATTRAVEFEAKWKALADAAAPAPVESVDAAAPVVQAVKRGKATQA